MENFYFNPSNSFATKNVLKLFQLEILKDFDQENNFVEYFNSIRVDPDELDEDLWGVYCCHVLQGLKPQNYDFFFVTTSFHYHSNFHITLSIFGHLTTSTFSLPDPF